MKSDTEPLPIIWKTLNGQGIDGCVSTHAHNSPEEEVSLQIEGAQGQSVIR